MKQRIERPAGRKHRPSGKGLTKSIFRQFNRKTASWKQATLGLVADKMARGGKAFIDQNDRIIICGTIVRKVVIIILPAPEVRDWCGTPPKPFPLPPAPPCPEPVPCGPMPGIGLDKSARMAVGGYLSAVLKGHDGELNLTTLGRGFHSIAIGNKASLLVMGNL